MKDSSPFKELAAICCESMTKRTPATFAKFLSAFEKFPTEEITPEISNYLIAAFLIHLKVHSNLSDAVRLSLYKPMERLLTQCQVNNFTFFLDIFQHFNMILGMKQGKPTTDFHNGMPEDTTKCVVNSLLMLLQNNLPSHQDKLYDEQNVKIVGHCIYMQLQIVRTDAVALNIRLHALQVVRLLIEACSGSEQKCHEIFNFLPGIVNALRQSGSAKVGRVWKRLVVNSVHLLETSIVNCISFESPEKLEQVDQNLSIVLKAMSNDLVSNEAESLRCALLDLSMGIISQTDSKLPKCMDLLWKNILVMSCDNSASISSKSRSLLLDKTSKDSSFLCDIENVLQLLKQAQEHFVNNNEEESIVSLKCVASSLLVKKLIFLELRTLLPLLANLLTSAIVQNRFDLDRDSNSVLFKSNPMLSVCHEVCKNIFLSSTLDDVFDEIVSLISIQQNLSLEDRVQENFLGVIYCFNVIVDSLPREPSTALNNLDNYDLCNIANLYLEVLQSQTELINSEIMVKTPRLTTIAEYEAILLVQGVGILATLDRYSVLPVVLYSLLEQAGSNSGSVSRVAKDWIQNIALNRTTTLVEESIVVTDFLSDNLDLIMSELSVRTASISSHPNCPNAITFLASYFDFAQTDFVALIERIFTQSCDTFYNLSSQVIFTKIFLAFMISLSTHHHRQNPSELPKPKCDSLCTNLLNYQTAIGIETSFWTAKDNEKIVNESETENPLRKPQNETEEEEEAQLPPELNLSLRICERVLNFLPSSDERNVQLTAIDCLIMGVKILRNNENFLLPLAHTIWQNLAPRFQEKDLVVVRKSFELLLTLCDCSGSFLKKRVVEEVFPKLSAYLLSLVAESERLRPKRTLYYTFTQSYKLQLIILEGLVDLCMAIELTEEELDQVASSCLVYVKPEQHKNLREAALKVIDGLGDCPLGRVIWMKLIAHGLREVPDKPPHPEFIPLPDNLHGCKS